MDDSLLARRTFQLRIYRASPQIMRPIAYYGRCLNAFGCQNEAVNTGRVLNPTSLSHMTMLVISIHVMQIDNDLATTIAVRAMLPRYGVALMPQLHKLPRTMIVVEWVPAHCAIHKILALLLTTTNHIDAFAHTVGPFFLHKKQFLSSQHLHLVLDFVGNIAAVCAIHNCIWHTIAFEVHYIHKCDVTCQVKAQSKWIKYSTTLTLMLFGI